MVHAHSPLYIVLLLHTLLPRQLSAQEAPLSNWGTPTSTPRAGPSSRAPNPLRVCPGFSQALPIQGAHPLLPSLLGAAPTGRQATHLGITFTPPSVSARGHSISKSSTAQLTLEISSLRPHTILILAPSSLTAYTSPGPPYGLLAPVLPPQSIPCESGLPCPPLQLPLSSMTTFNAPSHP